MNVTVQYRDFIQLSRQSQYITNCRLYNTNLVQQAGCKKTEHGDTIQHPTASDTTFEQKTLDVNGNGNSDHTGGK